MSWQKYLNPIRTVKWSSRVFASASARFYWDDCFSRAAALSYTTLFALVPIFALGVSIMGGFGMNQESRRLLLKTILDQVLPRLSNANAGTFESQILEHVDLFTQNVLQTFTTNVQALNYLSIGALIFTCVALVNTIESALNAIWRVSSELTLQAKITNFWTIVSIGPFLIALSIYWSSQLRELAGAAPFFDSEIFPATHVLLPAFVSWAAVSLLFYKLPAARVGFRDAALGALVSAFFFEALKIAFAHYVNISRTYSTFYGAIATIPLFLFWLYLTWVVVLLGAEVAYQAGSIKILSGRAKYATDLGEVGAVLGLRILSIIGRNFLEGLPAATEGEIALSTGSDPVLVRSCLDLLTKAGILTIADVRVHSRTLLIAPEKLSVRDVLRCFLARKERQKEAENGGEKAIFLQALLQAKNILGPERALESMTLRELVENGLMGQVGAEKDS